MVTVSRNAPPSSSSQRVESKDVEPQEEKVEGAVEASESSQESKPKERSDSSPTAQTSAVALQTLNAESQSAHRAQELQALYDQTAQQPQRSWDPRLSDPNLVPPVRAHLTQAPAGGEGTLYAASVRYEDEHQSGGKHHIFVKAPEGVDVYATDYNGQKTKLEEKFENGERFFEMPMWGGNTYAVHAEGRPGTPFEGYQSDVVSGLKMPANHHVNYRIDFQEQGPGPAVPLAPVTASEEALAPVPASAPASEPALPSAAPVASPASYVVQSGDSMYKIAAAHDVSFASLLEANPQFHPRGSRRPGMIFPGETLSIPKVAPAVQPAAPVQPAAQPAPAATAAPAAPAVAVAPAAAPATSTVAPPSTASSGSFIGANYTDLGRTDAGMPDPYSEGFRQQVRQDLDRLRSEGVDNVRVWASPGGVTLSGPEAMAQRVKVIGEEAQARGMTVVVDLIDSAGSSGMQEYLHGAPAQELEARMGPVVSASRHLNNISWSIGNELKAPDEPIAFANWYAAQAQKIRSISGNPNQGIVAELTPGAVGHPTRGWAQARRAMEIIAGASDGGLNIHFYPTDYKDRLPGALPNGTDPAADWESFQVWKQVADQTGRSMRVGEFSIPFDGTSARGMDYLNLTEHWLSELRNLGISGVRFWQLTKDEGGHLDPAATDDRGLANQGIDRRAFYGLLSRYP